MAWFRVNRTTVPYTLRTLLVGTCLAVTCCSLLGLAWSASQGSPDYILTQQQKYSLNLDLSNINPKLNGTVNELKNIILRQVNKNDNIDTDTGIKEDAAMMAMPDGEVSRDAKEMSEAYCNLRQNGSDSPQDGIVRNGYRLVHVHLLIRHGERTAMGYLPNLPRHPLSCQLKTTSQTSAFISRMDEILSASKNNRSVFRGHQLYPNSKTCDVGQLTVDGALSLLNLGINLRNIYAKHNFMDNITADSTGVYFRTTATSRTFQSAMALLYGLFPDLDFGKVKMDISQSATFCDQRKTGIKCNCPQMSQLHQRLKEFPPFNTKESDNIKSQIASVLDVQMSSLPWVGAMLESFMSYVCHSPHLPCNTKDPSKCITWPLIQQMWNYSNTVNKKPLFKLIQYKYDSLFIYPLLYEITSRMNKYSRGLEKTKFVLYSAHDLTLTPLLRFLGIHNDQWTPYGSHVALELYRKNADDFYVRVVYNGKDMTRHLPFCYNKDEKAEFCSLHHFLYYIRYTNLQKYFDKTNYQDACA